MPVRLPCLFLVALLLETVPTLSAATVTAMWDRNPEPDVAGYTLSYGTQSRVYSTTVDVGNVTGWPLRLTGGQRYYFAVQAYDTAGLSSPLSAEAFFDVPGATAQLTSPALGSMLTAATVQFQWTAGMAANDYWLQVGTAVGTADIFNREEGTSLNQTVAGLPTNGSTVYVRLWSLIGGGWQSSDYTYATYAWTLQAQLTTPAPGSTLTAAAVPFHWTSGSGVTDYWLYAGTTVGGADLFNQDEGTGLSQMVTGLPTNGSTVYVRLWSLTGGVWRFSDYSYATYALTPQAQLTTPAPGSRLTAASVPFLWTSGTGVADYWLYVGTTLGGAELLNYDEGMSLSQIVTGLPTDGRTVYVRLWSLIGGVWLFNDYPLTATTPPAQLTTPVPGSTLPAVVVPFQWTSGTGVADYWLSVSTTAGGSNLVNRDEGTSLSETATGLPTDGSTVYVRLWSLINGAWKFNDYTYTAVTPQAQMTAPALGPPLTASSVSFQWTIGTWVTDYWLWVGTTVGGMDLFNQDEGTSLSQVVTGLPTNGSGVYVRLWSLIGGVWQYNDYIHTAVTPQAQMTTAAPGSRLTGSTVWFQWTQGTGVTDYWLSVGTIAGGDNLFSQNEGMNLGGMVMGVPTDGSAVYVRLWSLIGGAWQFNDYTYTAH